MFPANSKEVEASFSVKLCDFDIKKGAQPPETAGIMRWGSALWAAGYLDSLD